MTCVFEVQDTCIGHNKKQFKFNFLNIFISKWCLSQLADNMLPDYSLYNGDDALSQRFVTQNYGRLHVYLESLDLETMTETPSYRMTDLFADIGGILGLYLGLSIGTIFELIQYVFFLSTHSCWGSKDDAEADKEWTENSEIGVRYILKDILAKVLYKLQLL